jgi:Zn-dependent protease
MVIREIAQLFARLQLHLWAAIFQVRAPMSLSPEDIRWIVIRVFVLVTSVAFHEFGHAIMADRLGDDTPRRQGRVTLNPIAHTDPIGTLLLPVLGGIFAAGGSSVGGFGWGRPVQWQPSRVARKWSMSTAKILVALAGPSMNILLAVLVAGVHTILVTQGVIAPYGHASQIMFFAVMTNFILFFFNLVPAPPLDGGHVAEGFMPYKHRSKFEQYARFGPFIVLAIVMISPLAQIFVIPATFCGKQLYALMGMI